MTDATTKLDPFTKGVIRWLSVEENAQRCYDATIEMRDDPDFGEHLSDWIEDAVREDAPEESGDLLFAACRMADWKYVARLMAFTWAGEGEEDGEDEE